LGKKNKLFWAQQQRRVERRGSDGKKYDVWTARGVGTRNHDAVMLGRRQNVESRYRGCEKEGGMLRAAEKRGLTREERSMTPVYC